MDRAVPNILFGPNSRPNSAFVFGQIAVIYSLTETETEKEIISLTETKTDNGND